MSAASEGSVDSDSGIRPLLAIKPTLTAGVVGVITMRKVPSRIAIEKTLSAKVAGGVHSMFQRRRYHAIASPDDSSDMMNITPHIPSHDAVCSSGRKSTCVYAGLP